MSLQTQFLSFHDSIHMEYEKRSTLAEKRDGIIQSLRDSGKLPSFEVINQGSYSMFTGIEPIPGLSKPQEYDLDVGLIFNTDKDYMEPYSYKEIIYQIINKRTDYGADIKKPCVTLTYKDKGEAAFHIDIVSYVYADKDNKNSQLYLAKGKSKDDQEWNCSDPKGLVNYVNSYFSEDEKQNQCRRIVRYLKHWKVSKFGKDHSEPASIGITLFTFEHFSYEEGNDLAALIKVVTELKNEFYPEYSIANGDFIYKIKYYLSPKIKADRSHNLFEKMSDYQMNTFRDKTCKLLDDLQEINREPDLVKQCEMLSKIFGEKFPIPEKRSVSKTQESYIPYTSSSGQDINLF